MAKKAKPVLVLNTCPDPITAKEIATRLVAEKLAACVQVVPGIKSYFTWNGKMDSSEEQLLIIKTTSRRYPELEGRIKQFHPYALPEILAVPISTGLPAYLSWIEDCTDSS